MRGGRSGRGFCEVESSEMRHWVGYEMDWREEEEEGRREKGRETGVHLGDSKRQSLFPILSLLSCQNTLNMDKQDISPTYR